MTLGFGIIVSLAGYAVVSAQFVSLFWALKHRLPLWPRPLCSSKASPRLSLASTKRTPSSNKWRLCLVNVLSLVEKQTTRHHPANSCRR